MEDGRLYESGIGKPLGRKMLGDIVRRVEVETQGGDGFNGEKRGSGKRPARGWLVLKWLCMRNI
jgi:hypothetical protein